LVDFEIRNISIVFLSLERDENRPGTDIFFQRIPNVGYRYLHEKKLSGCDATRRYTRTHNTQPQTTHHLLITRSIYDRVRRILCPTSDKRPYA